MPTYGQHPSDVVQDSRGNAIPGVLLQFYLTEAEARSDSSPVGSAVSDEYGTWEFTTSELDLWTRLPNGRVWQVAHSDADVVAAAQAAQAAAESARDDAVAAAADKLDIAVAASTYATKTEVTDGLAAKANSADVAATYETQANASATYETKANVASGLAAKLDSATAASTYETQTNVANGLAARSRRSEFDILDYGAVANDSSAGSLTANATAIAGALSAASAAYVSTGAQQKVRIPLGDFWVQATTGRTFTIPAGVTVEGDDRRGSRIRVHSSSGDWAYLFCYPSSGACDKATFRRLTLDGSTYTSPTGTVGDFSQARTLINTIGADVVVEDCDLLCNGVWAIHHVGDNVRIVGNDITVDMTGYTLGWFDQSIVWGFSQNGRVQDNTFTVVEAATNTFVVQTAIEFQGHRNVISNNVSSPGTRFTRMCIFTASTYYNALTNFYPASPKGAVDNVIESNRFTVTKYGVEIWGMVVTSPEAISGLRIRRNAVTVDNSAGTVTASALVSFYIGTAGAGGNDGPQTSPVTDLKISDNVLRFGTRRVSTSYITGDALVRLCAEVTLSNVVVSGNRTVNCGGFGVLANVDAAYSVWVDGVEVLDNQFTDVREPVRIVRNVKNYRVEGNVFEQTQVYGTINDNMIETVAQRPGDWATESGGVIRNNTVRTQSTHKAYYPQRDHGISQAYAPASRGYVVEEMNPKIQIGTGVMTLGTGQVARRYSDGVLVKPSVTMGATLGTLSGVTISAVQDNSNMTVNDATNIYPGQILALPTAVFTSPSAFVLAVVGNAVKTAATNLNFQAGKTSADAAGQSLTYYGTVVTA